MKQPSLRSRPATAVVASPIGAYLAHAAHEERASVDAFERLAVELRAHGAPDALVRAAERSAREERAHAEEVARLARAHGEAPVSLVPAPREARDLFAVALENAVEGCARAGYRALLALHQGEHAADPAVRSVMGRIARDEVRHASLAWAVAAWAEARLDPEQRAEIAAARTAVWEEMIASLAIEPSAEVANELGLPTGEHATRFARALRASLAERAAKAA